MEKAEETKYDSAHIAKVLKKIEAKFEAPTLAIDRLKTIFNWSDGEIPVPDFEIDDHFDKPSIKIGYQTFHIEENEPLSITKPKCRGHWKLVEEDNIGILTVEWVKEESE